MRPLTSNEIMDVAIGAYQSLGRTILKLTAVPTLLCLASVTFIFSYVIPAFGLTQHSSDVGMQVIEAAYAMALGLFIGGPLFLVGISYSSSLITQLVSDYMVGNVPNPAAAQQGARSRLTRMLKLNLRELLAGCSGLLVGIACLMASALADSSDSNLLALTSLLGVLAFVFGGALMLIVVCRHALAAPALLIEEATSRQAAKRSASLLKGGLYHPSGYNNVITFVLVSGLLVGFIFGGIVMSFDAIGIQAWIDDILAGSVFHDLVNAAFNMTPWFLVIWTVVPVWCTATTILYYERRARLEGYDIEALAQDVWRTDKQSRFQL